MLLRRAGARILVAIVDVWMFNWFRSSTDLAKSCCLFEVLRCVDAKDNSIGFWL
jgi:hypothetical protein